MELAVLYQNFSSISSEGRVCQGEGAGGVEARVTINTVLRRMPDLRLAAQDMEWRYNPVFRGLKSLPVVF